MELLAIIVVTLVVLWATGLLATLRKIAGVANSAIETGADMSQSQLKVIEAEHKSRLISRANKLSLTEAEVKEATAKLEAIKAFKF